VFHWCYFVSFPQLSILCFTGIVLYRSLNFIFCASLVLFCIVPSTLYFVFHWCFIVPFPLNNSETQNTKLRERYKTIQVKHKILSWGNDTKQHQWNTKYYVEGTTQNNTSEYRSLYFIFCVSLVFYCTLPSTLYFVFHWCFIVPFPLLYILCFTGVVLYPSEGTIQKNTSETQNIKLRERYKTISVKHKILSWGNDTKQYKWNTKY
jgi:hypothetical protein